MLSRATLLRSSFHPQSAFRAFTPTARFFNTTPHHHAAMAAPTDTAAAETANTSGITTDTLTSTLKSKLDASHVEIEDMSGGCGQAFSAIIVSSQFDKKTLLARHRLVNSALKTEIAAIHAWTPRCYTLEQWEKEKEKGEMR